MTDNVLAGAPPARRIGPLLARDRRRARERTRTLLEQLGIDVDPRDRMGALAPAERKLIEIARALAADARTLVLDEPTAGLDPRGARRLIDLLARLRTAGVAVLFVSHKLDEVLSLADRVTVLQDGAVSARREARDLRLPDLVRLIVGGAPSDGGALPSAPIDFDVAAGEILGLTGLLGSGASAFGRSLAAVAAGAGLVPEDRRRDGIVPELSVERNIALASVAAVARRGCLSRRRMRTRARRYIELLDIRPPNPTMPAGDLSGGNQQKVLLARWLSSGARVLVAEEPTHGLDVGAKAEIRDLLRRFADDGGRVVLVSLEIAEYLELCDRIGVFRDGELVEVLARGATEAEILDRAVGAAA